ncbi:C1 family peptidase [Pseudobdellovibrio exovorus]|uniref:Aminopeptidase n=1 Tax=Pseudobdellovibrio exovorus JSS TaxID=1184267 RepID=M4V9V5_9BACT|nr:C1 family peptidase [Pseudobdellovibrio exovorus]AGH95240.1 hypothetical protein A11Q_1024 [Pseudobdellovibrio exovorus JSS]
MHFLKRTHTFIPHLASKLLLAGLLILSFDYSLAAVRCSALFTPLFGTLRPDFKHNRNYTKELPQGAIKNQCSLGTCHLHSWVSQLESTHKQRTGQNISLSTHYLSMLHWHDSVIRTLEADNNAVRTELGASVYGSRRIMLQLGLVPDAAWTFSRSFHEGPFATRMSEYLQNIVARAKARNATEINPEKKRQTIESAKAEIKRTFEEYIGGGFNMEFTYRNKKYTPRSFQQEFFPELSNPIVHVFVNANRRVKTEVDSNEFFTLVDTNINTVERLAKDLIDNGQNVYVAYDHNGNFVSGKTGIMSISAFNMPQDGRPLSRTQRDQLSIRDGGHAVQIVGYEIDPTTGRVIKWKVQNSWGREAGDNGFYHMYADYFRSFVSSITFYRNDKIQLPENEVHRTEQLELDF